MSYSPVSVKRKSANAGRPAEKVPYIVLVRVADLATYARDDKGVKISSFALADGKKAIAVFNAPDKNAFTYKGGGEKGISSGNIHAVEAVHPGTTLEIDEFIENYTNVELMAIQVIAGEDAKVAGTPYNPLYIEAESDDSSKGRTSTLKFSQLFQGPVMGHLPSNLLPAVDDTTLINVTPLTLPGV